jgi:hypothetical protein
MRTIFWIALGGVAVYLLSKKSDGAAPAATAVPLLPPTATPIVSAGPVVAPATDPGWGMCPPGQTLATYGIAGGRCVPGSSVAPVPVDFSQILHDMPVY